MFAPVADGDRDPFGKDPNCSGQINIFGEDWIGNVSGKTVFSSVWLLSGDSVPTSSALHGRRQSFFTYLIMEFSIFSSLHFLGLAWQRLKIGWREATYGCCCPIALQESLSILVTDRIWWGLHGGDFLTHLESAAKQALSLSRPPTVTPLAKVTLQNDD